MTETRAVMLGFAAVAFVLIAVPFYFVWALFAGEPAPPAKLDGAISKAFLADEAKQRTPGAASVPNFERLLPPGVPVDAALATLGTSGFACKSEARMEICSRTLDWYSGKEDWRVTLALDATGRIRSSNARWQREGL